MPYRDEHGHFISKAEAIRRGIINEDGTPTSRPATAASSGGAKKKDKAPPPQAQEQAQAQEEETVETAPPAPPQPRTWVQPSDLVTIETGRGYAVEVPVGSPFVETIRRVAREAHYGSYFKIYLNSHEVREPTDAPATIEAGMRLMITTYDKPGLW